MAASRQRVRSVLHRDDVRQPILVKALGAGGFTLLEAMVALTLSTLIVSLVASVFLTQNDFCALVMGRSKVHDNLRVVSDLIASEIRGVSEGGVILAQSKRFVIRLPLAVGGVCHAQAGHGRVYMPGLSDISSNEVAGYARQDANGDWTYALDPWSNLLVSSGAADADECATRSGADTVGASQDYGRLLISGGTTLGEAMMIWQEVEFRVATSDLDPTTLAVYRGVTGDALREFATGIDSGTAFSYSTDGTNFLDAITGTALDSIQTLQVTTAVIAPKLVGTSEPYEYAWTVKIPLKNSN